MKLGLDTSRPAFVPLRDAMLCIECQFVTPASSGKCSICGGNQLVMLSELLELLVQHACGARAQIRLAELASVLVRSDSIPGLSSPDKPQEQEEPSCPEPYFDAFVEEDRSCSPPSQSKPAADPASSRNIPVSFPPRPRKKDGR